MLRYALLRIGAKHRFRRNRKMDFVGWPYGMSRKKAQPTPRKGMQIKGEISLFFECRRYSVHFHLTSK
jgi:hypothetical protein